MKLSCRGKGYTPRKGLRMIEDYEHRVAYFLYHPVLFFCTVHRIIMISPSVIFLLFSEPQSGTTTIYYAKYFVYLFILERQLTVRELDCVWWYGIWTYNPEARHFMFNLIKGA